MSISHTEPATGFAHFNLGSLVQRGIAAAGFVDPRPIQERTIPATLDGRDILGLAQTGTGKTAAFALPVLERLLEGRNPGPRVLIVAPTRELASQISAEILTLAQFTGIKVATVFGGVSVNKQITALRAKPEIVVACPGRLLDLMGQGAVSLARIETLVLDEADHMFDMGFLPDIRKILAALPRQRQNLLFSATMQREIRRLANQILEDPHVVELNHSRPVETIEHAVYPIEDKSKLGLLERVLADKTFVSAIVFTRTKHRAKRLARQLDASGHRAVALQGNMSQNARERAMNGFRKREFDVLVATDIAARGIDVERVSHVVSFDMPNTPDAYTHRIGRTGRAERTGQAYTFVTAEDFAMVTAVERRIGEPIPRRSVEGIASIPFSAEHAGSSRPPSRGRRQPGAGQNRNRPGGGRGGAGGRSHRGSGRPRRRTGAAA